MLPVKVGSCDGEQIGNHLDGIDANITHVDPLTLDADGGHVLVCDAASEFIYRFKEGVVGEIIDYRGVRRLYIFIGILLVFEKGSPGFRGDTAKTSDGDDDDGGDDNALDKTYGCAEKSRDDALAVADSARESRKELV